MRLAKLYLLGGTMLPFLLPANKSLTTKQETWPALRRC